VTEAFRAEPWPNMGELEHTFVGVGFTPRTQQTEVRPVHVVITNYYTKEGETADRVHDEFDAGYWVREGAEYGFQVTGYPLLEEERRLIRDELRRMAPLGVGPNQVVDLFADVVRQVSRRLKNKWVGTSLVAVAVPKATAIEDDVAILSPHGRGAMMLSKESVAALQRGESPASLDRLMRGPSPLFLSFPEGSPTGVYASPSLGCPGMGALTNIAVTLSPRPPTPQ
jgi:hypothetical protein